MKKNKMFLPAQKPLSTCINSDCEDCPINIDLNCHFNLKQLIRFIAIVLPATIIGGYGIFIFNPIYIITWIPMFIIYFGFVEIRVMCSHCPHYAEPNLKSLKCWANYGSPKLWKYRPGPMTIIEKFIFITGALIIFVYPIPFLFLKYGILSYNLLGLYCISMLVALFLRYVPRNYGQNWTLFYV